MRINRTSLITAMLIVTCAANAQQQPTTEAVPTQTRPARRMVWDRTRVALELARREAQARNSVQDLEKLAKADPNAEGVQHALANARAHLERVLKERQEARREMGGEDVALERAAYLGIATAPATPVLRKHLKLPEGVGLVVDFVEPGSPAAVAGIQPHDVAHRLNDQILVNPQQLAVLVRTFEPGTAVTLRVFRGGKPIDGRVTLGEREVGPLPGGDHDVSLTADNLASMPGAPAAATPLLYVADTKEDPPLKPGDLVRVCVNGLGDGRAQTVLMTYVERDGCISLPQLKTPVKVEGTSGRKLVDAIRDCYQKAGVVEHPHVSVQLMKQRAQAWGKKE